ncbi:MAG: BamA/TamA family outer membrane protein [Opitutaceae bacterium]|jgi:outer membrane protein assembly complex protein YaeT
MHRNRLKIRQVIFLSALSLAPVFGLRGAVDASSQPSAERATLKVSGVGLLRDRELRLSLVLLLGTQRGATLNANAIEDAAVMLISALGEEGYQKPMVEIEATLADGTVKRLAFDASMEMALPRQLEARTVEFRVKPGARWYIDSVEISGLRVLPVKLARTFFRSKSVLFLLAKTNAYSPSHVENAAGALLGELRQRGYADAVVQADAAKIDQASGAVALHVEVTEGARWQVAAVRYEATETETVTLPETTEWIGRAWAPTLKENIKEAIRRIYYQKGFPDVVVRIAAEPGPVQNGQKPVTVVAHIQAGTQVKVGRVRFEGNAITRDSVLRRSAQVRPDEALNPLSLASARYRISRLGVFDTVDLHIEPPDGTVRDPVFTLKESQRYEANLLFGYGSYEQVRGGIELRQVNLFGMAHQSLIQLMQSMKSTSGDYTYSVPELLGESIDGTARLFALERREVAFLRQEFGATFTLKRPIPWLRAEGMVGYTFQTLRNRDNTLATQATDKEQLNVASVDFGLTSDHRDNPLRPRNGYRWFTQVELATRNLGGEAEYQRLELGAAYHTPWGEGRWIHIGVTHGVITTLGTTDATLPVNKRFFPGGDNSIRGYQKGEAAPRGADGLFIGAKSYVLLNLELEQALTPNWSVVVLADALGSAAQLRDYPFAERLYTVGLGVRYQTLVAPIRVEYGHNLNPRVGDPHGTWQISVGYPF